MARQDDHPSQAEGEDPRHPGSGEDRPNIGHPSQAEGEDPARSGGGDERAAGDA